MPNDMDVAGSERNPHDSDSISADAQTSVSSTGAVNAGAPPPAGNDAANEQPSDADAVAAEVESEVSRFQRLWRIIRSCTALTLLSSKWDVLAAQDSWLRIDMPPNDFVAAMEQDYEREGLAELGLYERVDGELRLASWLEGDAPFYVAIDEDNCTVSFSRGHEFLFPMIHTALDYALERVAPDAPQATATLFVVDSQDAVEVMRRLGLRAVTSEGLASIGREDILRLFTGDQRSDCDWRYYLLMLDFDLARLKNQPTAVLSKVIKRLSDAADVYAIDPARRFGVCRPSPQDFRVLERAISFEDPVQISNIFDTWATAAQRERITNWQTHFATKPTSFSVARAALTRSLQLPNEIACLQVPNALAAYRAASQETVIQKFYATIDRASDGFDQLNLIEALCFAERFFDADPLLRAVDAVMAGRPRPSPAEQAESFEQQQQCMFELRRIQRDLKGKR